MLSCVMRQLPAPSTAPAVVRVRVRHVLDRHRGQAAAAAGSARPLVRAHAAPPAALAPSFAAAVHIAPGTSRGARVPRRAACPQRRAKVAAVSPGRATPVYCVPPAHWAMVPSAAAAAAPSARPAHQAGTWAGTQRSLTCGFSSEGDDQRSCLCHLIGFSVGN